MKSPYCCRFFWLFLIVILLEVVPTAYASAVTDDDAEMFPAAQSSALLRSVSGDVRLKKRGSYIWGRAVAGTELYPGDKIYTGENARASIEYKGIKKAIEMKSQSLVRVGYEPPRMSQFKRIFGVERQGKNPAKGSSEPIEKEAGVRILGRPDDVSYEGGGTQSSDLSEDISEIRPLRILYPTSHTILGMTGQSARIAVQVESTFKTENLWVYVWQKGKGAIPVQKIFSRGDLAELRLTEPGKYILQIVCEDESCASDALRLEVIQGSRVEILEILKKLKFNANTSVVIP